MTSLRWSKNLAALLTIVLFTMVVGCGGKNDTTTTTIVSAADGLDLQAVGELMTKSKDAEDFEKLLNNKDSGVNNLDLDEDGNVDFIKVTELGDGSEYREGQPAGFSLTVDMGGGQEQEVASIHMEKTSDSDVSVEVRGNEQVYGDRHYHRAHFGYGHALLFSYMFLPHPYYYSPYRYGYYPGFYSPYRTVGVASYNSRATRGGNFQRSSSSSQTKTATNPNRGKTSQKVKAPLKKPTSSQKAFQARNPSKQIRSGGFGGSRRSSGYARRGGGPSRGGK